MIVRPSPFLPSSGGYRNLRAYKLSEIIYDFTSIFVKKYVARSSRTTDQMEQAARSGKQNIAEGSVASATSKETEIKLTNVAKASLEELLLDYEDYLRQHGLLQWNEGHPRFLQMRQYLKSPQFMADPMKFTQKLNAEEFCNVCITLINQCTYLLRRLLEKQQQMFLETGGIREQMSKARIAYRSQAGQSPTGQTSPTSPTSQKPLKSV